MGWSCLSSRYHTRCVGKGKLGPIALRELIRDDSRENALASALFSLKRFSVECSEIE
jgi:hypothetical protein